MAGLPKKPPEDDSARHVALVSIRWELHEVDGEGRIQPWPKSTGVEAAAIEADDRQACVAKVQQFLKNATGDPSLGKIVGKADRPKV